MSMFDGLGASVVGGGIGLLGSAISGNSANKAARDARGFQRKNQQKAANFLRSSIFGDMTPDQMAGGGDQFLPAAVQERIKQLDAMMNDPNISVQQAIAAQQEKFKLQTKNNAPIGTVGLSGIRDLLGQEQTSQLAAFDQMAAQQDAQGANFRGGFQSLYEPVRQQADQLAAMASQFGPQAVKAAQTAHDRSVSSGEAEIMQRMRARGLGSSNIRDNASIALRGQAAGGLSQAMAGIEAQLAQLQQQAGARRMDAYTGIANTMGGYDLGELGRQRGLMGQRFGLLSDFGNRKLGTYEQANNAVMGMASPSQFYSNPSLASPNQSQYNIGNALTDIGSTALGYGMRGMLAPRQGVDQRSLDQMRADAWRYGGIG